MIGCLRTRVRKQPIIVLYFEFENELKFYNLEARADTAFYVCVCIGMLFLIAHLTLRVTDTLIELIY